MLKQLSKKAVSLLMAFTMLLSFVPATAEPVYAEKNTIKKDNSIGEFVSIENDEDNSKQSNSNNNGSTHSNSRDAISLTEVVSAFEVGSQKFTDLQLALDYAASNTAKCVTVIKDVVIDGAYTIPSGVTLLIPFDEAKTLYTDSPGYSNALKESAKVFRTLTMAENATVTVKGAISVGGRMFEAGGSQSCKMAGDYGLIEMKTGSNITVENDGKLYAWGFISGYGSVTVKKGATVYEWYQINDFRGGNATRAMNNKKDKKVFPLSQYYVQNVEVPLTLYSGATEYTFAALYAGGQDNPTMIKFIGDGGLFSIKSGYFTKEYDGTTDRMIYTVCGASEMNNISIKIEIKILFVTVPVELNSKSYVLPINSNMTVNLTDGAKLTVNQDTALLPGTQLNIEQGAEFIVPTGINVFVYDGDNWGNYCGAQKKKLIPVQYAVSKKYDRSEADLIDSRINVNGVLTVNGALYTTAGGAEIISSEFSGKYVQASNPGTLQKTYQAVHKDRDADYEEIPVTAAKLRNSDNGFTETSKAAAGLTISNIRGVWGNEIIYYVNNKVVHTDLLPFASTVSQLYEYPKRDGYTLSAWETAEHTPAPKIMPADAVKLYATETPIKYTVTYDGLDGAINPSTNPKSYTVEDSFQLSEPQKTGYEFLGWSYTENGIQKQSKTFSVKKGTVGDIKLTAQWKKTDYSVRYIIDGAEVYTETHNYEESVGVWTPDAKTGYSFSGWTSSDVKADGGLFTMPAGNVTFTGSYLANKYTVYFGANGGSGVMEPQSFTYDTEQKLNENKFQKDDYIFVGWTMNGRELADGELVKNLTSENNGIVYLSAQWQVRTFTVSFDSDGGGNFESVTLKNGEKYPELPIPEKDGHTFLGWYVDDVAVKGGDIFAYKKDTTLTAKWKVNSYQLKYFVNGKEVKTADVPFGTMLSDFYSYQKTGYVVSAWRQANGSAMPETMPSKALELYATSEPAIYSITYRNVDGATVPSENPTSYTVEDEFGIVGASKTGYDFIGWLVDGEGSPYKVYPLKRNTVGNLVLVAKWSVKSHDVRYVVGGESYKTVSCDFDSVHSLLPYPEKLGYTFSGWTVTGAAVDDGKLTMPDNDVTVTGSFSPNSYTVVFDANGGTGEMNPQKFTYDAKQKLAKNEFTKVGYSFDGWTSGDNHYADEEEALNLTDVANGSVILIAKWKVNKYTVSFDTDGGTDISPITADFGAVVIAPEAPEKSGYEFVGWDVDIPKTMPAKDIKITAIWDSYLDKIERFDDFDGESLTVARGYYTKLNAEQKNSSSEKLSELVEAIKADGILKLSSAIKESLITANLKLGEKAHLTLSDNAYFELMFSDETLSITSFGETGILSDILSNELLSGIKLGSQPVGGIRQDIISAVAREAGYSVSDKVDVLDGKVMNVSFVGETAEKISFEVPYEIEFFNEYHLVSWKANGGTLGGEYSDGRVAYGTTITPPAINRTGYEFNGWNESVGTMGKKDIEFSASWSPVVYTVSFDSDGGTEPSPASKRVAFNTVFGALPTVSRVGYTFAGWYFNDDVINAEDILKTADNITLKAKWLANRYRMTFDSDGGDAIPPKNITFGDSFGELPTPTKTGYTFVGWRNGDIAVDSDTVLKTDGDITLTAVWSVNFYTVSYFVGDEKVHEESLAYGSPLPEYSYVEYGYDIGEWQPKFEAMPANNIEIRATKTPHIHLVKYIVDGKEILSRRYSFNENVTVSADQTKTGYTFSGWTAYGAEIEGGSFKMPDNDVELRGSFTPNVYTVIFDSNGGSGEMKPQEFTYDATERLAKNEFARVGYSFDGWSMGDVDYSDESEILNLSAEQNGSVTLYAKWKINKYTVSFDTAYGGTQLPPITADYGTAIVAPADPVREGYIFDGWDCEIPATMPAHNMTVTAKWISYLDLLLSVPDYEGDNLAVARGYYKFLNEDQLAQFGETDEIGYFIEAIYDYSLARLLDAVENAVEPTNKLLEVERGRIATLTLDGNHVDVRFDIEDYLAAAVANINFLTELFGYDEVKSITIGTETVILSGHDSSDQLSIMMAVAKASGVSLSGAGSTTVSVLDGKLLDVTLNCMTDESVEYDATYELEFFNNHHNVAWNPNGGALIGSYTDGMTAYGTQIVAPKATKYGYEFLGWDSDVDRMGKTDIEFNAIWQVGTYTVSYLVDGKTVHTEKVKYGEKIPEFSFTVPGYDVGAWQGLPELMPGEDINVSAEKTVHRHTLIYVVDGMAVSSETVDFGAEVILKADMHRDGYTFSGWKTEDAVIKDGKLIMPDNDVVLYGSYASNDYTVAFDSDGGDACEPISVRVGEKLGTLPMPRRSGYRFVGWFFNGIRVFPETVLEVTADVTLTARWEAVNYRIDYFGDGITSGANPDSYNIESETFELVNPDRDGFDFIGWTGSNGDIPEMRVRVPKGSVGELRFEANWKPTEYRVTFDCEKYYNGEASDEAVVNILERDFAARTVSFTVDASETGKMSAWLVYVSRDGENEELLTADNGIYSISEIYSDTVVKIVTVQRGDINLDGNVDAIDLTLFARFMAGIDNISELGYLAADCNGDGNIDAVDLTLFARYMAGIINDFG